MSKPAFTFGPWYVETTSAADGECNIVFPVNGNTSLSSQYVSREDAHLISAAPDLYDALDHFVTKAEKVGLRDANMPDWLPKARAALAKARGEQ